MCALVSLLAVLPFTTPTFEVEVERDVVYTQAEGYWSHAPVGEWGAVRQLLPQLRQTRPLDLEMDIYVPADDDPEARRPLLLVIHGGSFFVGSKSERGQVGWCEYFASLGYVAVSIDYRLGFKLNRKDIDAAELRALADADAALDYLLARSDLRIAPDRIFAAGTSAGAMTALRLAYRAEKDRPRIQAVANLWGAVHDLRVLALADTPILSYQSPDDPVMPYDRGYPFRTKKGGIQPPSQWFMAELYGTHAIHERAVELRIRAEHHPCPEPRHRLQLDDSGELTPRFYEIRDRMATFFAEELTPGRE